jgi:cobalt/nickel transport system permease protein
MLAVHLADGAVSPAWLAGGWVVAACLVFLFARHVPDELVARTAVLTAALFVASLVHLKVGPGSVHLLLNGLAGVLLGRRAVLAVTVSLVLQLLLFGHGGLTTLGLNVAVYSAPALAAARFAPRTFAGGAAVGGLTAAATVLLNAGVLFLGGSAGIDRLVPLVLVAHLPVVAVEGVVCGFAVRALAQAGNTSGNGVSH